MLSFPTRRSSDLMEGRGDPPAEPFERNASGQTAAADIDADQQQRPLDLRELQVVDPDHPAAIHVDDLFVEDLTREPELVFRAAVGLQAGLVDLQAQFLVVPASYH